MQPMQGDPEASRVLDGKLLLHGEPGVGETYSEQFRCGPLQLCLPLTDLWRVYFILLDEEGEQEGEMGWCVVHAGRADDAQERALNYMSAYHGQGTQWMGTESYDEPDPEGWPDELERIAQGVWI